MVVELTCYDGPRDKPVVGLSPDNVKPIHVNQVGYKFDENNVICVVADGKYVVVQN